MPLRSDRILEVGRNALRFRPKAAFHFSGHTMHHVLITKGSVEQVLAVCSHMEDSRKCSFLIDSASGSHPRTLSKLQPTRLSHARSGLS